MIDKLKHHWNVASRREFFTRAGSGLAGMALASMLAETGYAGPGVALDPLLPKKPHHEPLAKSVIFLFMEGGPSHVDLFDPKPLLTKLDGKPVPDSIGKPAQTSRGTAHNTLMASRRQWKQYGQSGMWVSDWYANMAEHVDDMTIIRSCWADGLNHVGSVCQMNTGSILAGRPSMGAWVTYGLGSANKNLPTFVVLSDGRDPLGGGANWNSGFLPALYQGTRFRTGDTPILDLKPPAGVSDEQQRNRLGLLRKMNQIWAADKSDDTELDARIRSFELAYQMQSAASDAVDLSQESEATKKMYGMDDPATNVFGTNCLMARKLVERGVRFIELYSGAGSGWDAHNDLEGNHTKYCRETDKPIAGLLADLKARGMLKDTLVVWGGEFGRTPFNELTTGRDHNPWGFTMWMAGGGAKGGQYVGTTDDIGLRAVENPVHVHDLHATILWMLGLDHRQLTFLHNGRAERPTVLAGEVVKPVFS
ncbi:MAG TPA: DUF1501 domain-containing protein [Candidatus Solibacter sp.]|nr:DUF1501 domain-containing protein [Candidatus Solibacter sp.]